MLTPETGPVYNVPLIDSLPLGSGGMTQAMPSRSDLIQVSKISMRTAAGYEVLLQKHHEQTALLAKRDARITQLEASVILRDEPLTDPLRLCSGCSQWTRQPSGVCLTCRLSSSQEFRPVGD